MVWPMVDSVHASNDEGMGRVGVGWVLMTLQLIGDGILKVPITTTVAEEIVCDIILHFGAKKGLILHVNHQFSCILAHQIFVKSL